MKQLSQKSITVQASQIRIMFQEALQHPGCLNLSIGEPDFCTPPHIQAAAKRAIDAGLTKYTPNAGIPELRQAIETHVMAEMGCSYHWDHNIIVTGGGVHALLLALSVLLDPGDDVLLGSPHWGNHAEQIRLCGANPVFVPTEEANAFCLQVEALEQAITPRTKVLLLCSPANPTGSVLGPAQLSALAEFAVRHDLFVVSDEVYSKLIYTGQPHQSIATLPHMAERTVVINSFSKTYAMTGWRVGYALGPEQIISNMIKFEENFISCVNTPAQYGALEALQGDQQVVIQMREAYRSRRDQLVQEINQIPGIHAELPSGAFYLFANIAGCGMRSWDFALELLHEQDVVVVPGSAFGACGEGFIRISYATSSDIIHRSMERIYNFVTGSRFRGSNQL